MNPQAADGGAGGAGHEFRCDVAHRERKQREHERADDVPAGHVKLVETLLEERRQELYGGKQQCEHDEKVDHQRELGPLERLTDARQHENPAWRHDGEVPDGEHPEAERPARDPAAGQNGYRVIQEREEGIAQPAEHDALRMRVTQAAPAQWQRAAGDVRCDELQRHQDAETDGDQERDERGDTVRVDKSCIDTIVHVSHGYSPLPSVVQDAL